MARRTDEIEAEIARRLAATRRPGSPNEINAPELRAWAIEYLRDNDEEEERFPDIAGEPHWNLWMADARHEDAHFAVLVFRPEGVEFFCGTGDAFAVRRFAERDFPDDVDRVPPEMALLFRVPEESLLLDREEAEAWLERGW